MLDTTPPAAHKPNRPTVGRWIRDHLVVVFGILALLFMFAPIANVVRFSFNKPEGKINLIWNQFSLDAWKDPCGASGLCDSLWTSIWIGVVATAIATGVGTLAAFGMSRHRFRGRGLANVLVFLPMATPEVVAGSSLLTLFLNLGVPLGAVTVVIAHVMFCLSFVIVTVKARLAGMDPTLEQAAQDLYADPTQTFWRVTFPLVLPGIVSAAMLSFSLSFDDFIITNFNSGSTVTFPMYVWGAAQRGLAPQVNVVGTGMLVIALTVVVIGRFVSSRRAR
ncbi:ABC transporter permease [Nakamurella antarctica]|uniref:ABC transporter permease n=1 Tax=Nakamurella antarctica TaxID=1902245 RepID=A0A3G8ZPX1_9ACTN|nr:ABC transporter permease [Nakamurella antarctica]